MERDPVQEVVRQNRQRQDSKIWFPELACTVLKTYKNTGNNLQNPNVAKINPNNNGMTEAEDNFSDCSKKSLFLSVLTNHSFETLWQRHCKAKKHKEEDKQAPEKPSKALEIMEDINKSLQSTPSSDDLFGMIVAPEIRILLEESQIWNQ